MAAATSTAPPADSVRARAPMVRPLFAHAALALGVASLLGVARQLAAPPRGVAVQDAAMAMLPTGVSPNALPSSAHLDWQPLDAARLAEWTGPYVLRYRVTFTAADTTRPHGIAVALRAAFVATWDGVPLPANGRVGTAPADERPGRVDWTAPVPAAHGGAGPHELRIVASSHRQGAHFGSADVRVSVAPVTALATSTLRAWLVPLLALGALAGALGGVLTVIGRSGTGRDARGLAALGGAAVLLTAAEAWRPLLGYAYPLHALRLRLVLLCTGLTMYLLVRYVQRRVADGGTLPARRGVALLPVAWLVFAVVSPTYDVATWSVHVTGMGVALLLIVRQREARRRLAMVATVLGTALVAAVLGGGAYLDGAYLIALAALLLVVVVEHGAFLRDRAARAQALEGDRLRLTAALVHRSIQPHWLMNTLTGLQELIEHDPPRASRVVELLADEFRTVSDVSRRRWIGGEEELALCRTHLAIVSHALPAPRVLAVHGETLLAEVAMPPGVLHTLVENALTHAGTAPPPGGDDLALACTVDRDDLVLDFDAPSGRGGDAARRGTGTQFVERSLEAAFPGRWSHRQQPGDGRWRVTLRVPLAAARAARAHVGRAA